MTGTNRPLTDCGQLTDWDALFDGNTYLCEQGIDYECSTKMYLLIVRDKAKKMGLSIKVEETDNGFVVQAEK